MLHKTPMAVPETTSITTSRALHHLADAVEGTEGVQEKFSKAIRAHVTYLTTQTREMPETSAQTLIAAVTFLRKNRDGEGLSEDLQRILAIIERIVQFREKEFGPILQEVVDVQPTREFIQGLRIARKLGEGGMSVVFLAIDARMGRAEALKLLKTDDISKEELEAEATTVARIAAAGGKRCINIYGILDDEETGKPVMRLEYMKGMDGQAFLGHEMFEKLHPKGFSPLASLLILEQMTLCAREAHKAGTIHRDIKPENFMVSREVIRELYKLYRKKKELTHQEIEHVLLKHRNNIWIKIFDFGISISEQGTSRAPLAVEEATFAQTLRGTMDLPAAKIQGTILYMPPESMLPVPDVGEHTDFFALGLTFYQLLTGKSPNEALTHSEGLSLSNYSLGAKGYDYEAYISDRMGIVDVSCSVDTKKDPNLAQFRQEDGAAKPEWDLLTGLLEHLCKRNKRKRISGEELLQSIDTLIQHYHPKQVAFRKEQAIQNKEAKNRELQQKAKKEALEAEEKEVAAMEVKKVTARRERTISIRNAIIFVVGLAAAGAGSWWINRKESLEPPSPAFTSVGTGALTIPSDPAVLGSQTDQPATVSRTGQLQEIQQVLEKIRRSKLTIRARGDQKESGFPDEFFELLGAQEELSLVEELSLQGFPLSPDQLATLLNSDHLRLTSLTLKQVGAGDAHIAALASGVSTAGLRKLSIPGSDIGNNGLKTLCDAGILDQLTELSLPNANISDEGVRILADTKNSLETLDLSGNTISPQANEVLQSSPNISETCILILTEE
jgi:serine/threonine protein kinase